MKNGRFFPPPVASPEPPSNVFLRHQQWYVRWWIYLRGERLVIKHPFAYWWCKQWVIRWRGTDYVERQCMYRGRAY